MSNIGKPKRILRVEPVETPREIPEKIKPIKEPVRR